MATESNYQRLKAQESPASSRYVSQQGLSRYKPALQSLLPVRINTTTTTGPSSTLPLEEVGFFSSITFHWLTSLLWAAYRTNLTELNLPPADCSDINGQRLAELWNDSIIRSGQLKSSMTGVVWRFVRTRLIVASLLQLIAVLVAITSPWAVVEYLLHLKVSPTWTQRLLAACIVIGIELVAALIKAWSASLACRTAGRLRSAYLSMTYKKLLRLDEFVISKHWTQKILSDADIIHTSVLYGGHVITVPLVLIACIAVMAPTLELAAFAGSAFLITLLLLWVLVCLAVLLNGHVAILSSHRWTQLKQIVDNFVVLKMAVLESVYLKLVSGLQNCEVGFIGKYLLCDSISEIPLQMMPLIAAMLVFCELVEPTSVKNMLVVILLFTHIKDSLYRFRCGLLGISRASPVLQQFKNLLILEDWETFKDREKPLTKEIAISMKNASYMYRNISPPIAGNGGSKKSRSKAVELSPMHSGIVQPLVDITLQVNKGSLMGVVGPGSSALLLAMLGQLKSSRGLTMRDGNCVYVNGEKPWLNEGSEIRDNIVLMGSKFDQKRYYQSLHNCCLIDNLNTLQHGERTIVANSNLTRSEVQRIALARIAYANRDIYLLDEPMNAVGTEISNEVFNRTILTALKGKTIVLATNNIQYLRHCDEILVLKDCRLVEQGSHEDLLAQGQEYTSLVQQLPSGLAHYLEADFNQPTQDALSSNDNLGQVPHSIHYALGWFTITLVALLLSVAVLFTTMAAIIVNIHTMHSADDWFNWFIHVQYAAAICAAAIILGLIWRLLYSQTVKSASQKLHSTWLKRLLGASIGMLAMKQEVLQTFTLHTQLMNDILTRDMRLCIENFAMLVGCAGLLMFKTPWSLVPLVLFYASSVLFIAIYRGAVLRINSAVTLKKEELTNFVDTSVEGRTTIQCLSRNRDFTAEFSKLCDSHASDSFLLQAASYWISIRIHMLAVLFIGGVIFAGCHAAPETESYLFVVLVASWQLPGYFRRAVKGLVATEIGVTALKRGNELMFELDQETQRDSQEMKDGSIDFSGVHTNAGLQGVTFNMEAGEQYGVLGGGRLAVIDAMYGLVDVTLGDVTVGDVSLSFLPLLSSYRSQIGVIPLDAPMLSLSARLFLDPHGKNGDNEIQEVLTRLGLEATGLGRCANISQRVFTRQQRELMWLARAVLNRPKVLVLQECTHVSANMVASILQDVTVLVVAGQIDANDLVSLNRVLVITEGKVAEFGKPQQLYRQNKSVVSQMIATSTGHIFETEL